MKKLLIAIPILIAIGATAVGASVWQYGSYQERAEMAAMCGIFGYRGTAQQNLSKEVQECFKTFSGEYLGFSVITRYRTTLSSSMTSSQSTIPVSSMKTFDGDTITMAMLGSKVYLTVEPGSNREEIIKCTGISGSSWTGCTRGLAFSGTDESSVVANRKAHNAGSTVVISNVHYVYEELIDKDSNNTSTAKIISKDMLAISTMCLYDTNYCFRVNDGMIQWTVDNFTNSYNFTSSTISQLTASSTRAIGVTDSKVHLNISDDGGLVFDGSTGYLETLLNNSITSGTDGLAVNTSTDFTWSGDQTWTGNNSFTGSNSFTGENTFSATTTIYGINKISLVAGEAILRGDAVAIGNGSTQYQEAKNTTSGTEDLAVHTDVWLYQTFKTTSDAKKISSVKLKLKVGVNSTAEVRIYATTGSSESKTPTGSSLGSATAVVSETSATVKTFTFATPISVDPETEYAIVLLMQSGGGITWQRSEEDEYANGNSGNSTNTGSSYNVYGTWDFYFEAYEIKAERGKLYKTNASVQGDLSDNFIGFASNSVSSGGSVDIIVNGVSPIATSTLTIGNFYYLSDTLGKISMSTTTSEKQVGIAIDTNKLLIKY
jgi:hypothetical protein